MKEIYILGTERVRPVKLGDLQGAFESENVELVKGTGGLLFTLKAGEALVEVRFEKRAQGLGWTPELITGSPAAHRQLREAKGFYRLSFEPGVPQPSVAVFEALWCARAILEKVGGVLLDVCAFKLHDLADVVEITELEFDIRDHLALHAVEATQTETPLWVHSHGMEKFGSRDVEIFHLGEQELQAAESFLHELCTDLAFGQGPVARTPVSTSEGASFMLLPSEEARLSLFGVPADSFEGHEGRFLTVVSAEGRHTVAEVLRPFHDRFEAESAEETESLSKLTQELRPAFKARFQRKGLMEPLSFLIRAPFESHPTPEEPVLENLWVEVVAWEDKNVIGKLVDGGQHTTEWRKGAHVELEEESINALAVTKDGRPLEESQMRSLLVTEKPS